MSIMVQYYKQRKFPHGLVQKLQGCNDQVVPLEVLVNVDHIQVMMARAELLLCAAVEVARPGA